ncbi:MAG: 1-deoxy-D-xylulose-5-phosphate synthase [Armatimonadota bacterium]|jgi:1-deoxy-D-xylulose-5-phosphate synthase
MSELLDGINQPSDLRELSGAQLRRLAAEIREVLISTTARHGGHLASNLGVVELTIALHLVLDSPRDKIIWDVSHQTYTHKLLTGRRDRFDTLRQWGGLAGFSSPEESEHDHFVTGHGSTAISAALGMGVARDMHGTDETIAAVVGDGALSGGLAMEGLNQAGHRDTDLLVVLNDNEMSIARNVGGMAEYLNRLRTDPHYLRARDEFATLMQRLPMGATMLDMMERFKGGLRHLVVPGMLFEELGFRYLGPIGGHDIPRLQETLAHARDAGGPVFVHVLTEKGRGYGPAEKEPAKWHGASPFDAATGRKHAASATPTCADVLAETAVGLAEDDERIVGITAAMADGTGMERFADRFPDRCFDVGMAEEHAVTFAGGLARAGARPIVAIYSTFLQRAYDQMLHDVCLQNLPVVFAIDRAGIVGEDGPTHQGIFDLSYLRTLPNMTVMAPASAPELRAALRYAVRLGTPVAVRYPRGSAGSLPGDGDVPPFAGGRPVLLREGQDCVVLAIGAAVTSALEAATELETEGLAVGVVNSRFAKPLHAESFLQAVRSAGRVVTVEENSLVGGFGAGVLELLSSRGCADVSVLRVGLADAFVEHGDADRLRALHGVDAAGIAAAVRRVCARAPEAAPLRGSAGH